MSHARAYYNEHDEFAAQWLRNLIEAGQIAPGDVDTRSIDDVRPSDLSGYSQCHFFAGIGVWSYALRQAGWPDHLPVWTGSCPCQSFSQAGQRTGFDDERHLWPSFFHLIQQCSPRIVFGEQVASKDALAWVDLVQADLEGEDYAFAAVDTCAAGFGSPQIRQRLYWVADTYQHGCEEQREARVYDLGQSRDNAIGRSKDGIVGNTLGLRGGRHSGAVLGTKGEAKRSLRCVAHGLEPAGPVNFVADPNFEIQSGRRIQRSGESFGEGEGSAFQRPEGFCEINAGESGPTNGFWRDADWLLCRDGKWRPVEPGTFPLVTGASGRVGRLRAYGNALNAAQAQGFIEAYLHINTVNNLLT